MGRPGGQLERSLDALMAAGQRGAAEREHALADTVTGEYEQQVHVPLSGVADVTAAFVDVPVQWELPFLYAPLQRRVPYPTPHFLASIEHTVGQGALVIIHASVIGWDVTSQLWYAGAMVRFDVSAPLATGPSPYAAIAHCSFQGFATMAE